MHHFCNLETFPAVDRIICMTVVGGGGGHNRGEGASAGQEQKQGEVVRGRLTQPV